MKPQLRAGWWGMLVSFLGSLPLGTQNIVATGISITQGAANATFFAIGSVMIELICVRIVLIAIGKLTQKIRLFNIFKWLTIVLLLVLAVGSFIAAVKMKSFGNNIFTAYHIHPFLLGILLSAFNPLHIPFWLGWTTILINKNILHSSNQYYAYIAGIGTGTILGFDVFIYGGDYLVEQLNNRQNIINWVVGSALLTTAIIEIYKLVYKPKPVEISIAKISSEEVLRPSFNKTSDKS